MKPARPGRRGSCLAVLLLLALAAGAYAFFPYRSYFTCGSTQPAALPATVRVGLYEEFPAADRLAKLNQVDFPASLAVTATSRQAFLELRDRIFQDYPAVRDVYFWPLLTPEQGYYPGPLAGGRALRQAAEETAGLPTLWDVELPRKPAQPAWGDWLDNRDFTARWLATRTAPTHVWRSWTWLGLDPWLLRVTGLHYDPRDYGQVWLHLDLYTTGKGLPADLMATVLRCGVERYGERFIPAFGVLDDGVGEHAIYLPPDTLERDLVLARAAGVSEVWIFGVNGLNADYLAALHTALPLETFTPPAP
jgi:hypothetical protein